MLNVTRIEVGAFGANCYIIWTKALDTLIIDPGANSEAISKIISKNRLTLRAYLITHGHLDHVGALAPLFNRIPASIAMHASDAKWAFGAANQMPPYYSTALKPPLIDRILKGGEKWHEEGFHYEVISTPGHSPGSVCFYFPEENILFSGDTLFRGSVGRTDLPGGDMKQLTSSLRSLAALRPCTKVCPGHGPETTIGDEIDSNPFLKIR